MHALVGNLDLGIFVPAVRAEGCGLACAGAGDARGGGVSGSEVCVSQAG